MVHRNPESHGRSNPPMFNAPRIVVWMIGTIVGIHIVRQIMPQNLNFELSYYFAFIPVKYTSDGSFSLFEQCIGFVSYMFLHGDFMHVGFNSLWLLVFATPLARRWRTRRLLFFYLVCGALGALVHLLLAPSSSSQLIGASGGVSAMMGAAVRFALFSSSGLGGMMHQNHSHGLIMPLTDRRVLAFSGVWIAINLVFGLSAGLSGGNLIAWDVHLVGYVAGLLLFPWFDGYGRGSSTGGGSGGNGKDRSHIRVVK